MDNNAFPHIETTIRNDVSTKIVIFFLWSFCLSWKCPIKMFYYTPKQYQTKKKQKITRREDEKNLDIKKVISIYTYNIDGIDRW